MTPKNFKDRIKTLIARGYDPDKAEELANTIGDIIETDADGKWVLRDQDESIIARIDPC